MIAETTGIDYQTMANWLFAVLCGLIGLLQLIIAHYIRNMQKTIEVLQAKDEELGKEVNAIKIDYATRPDLEAKFDKVMAKLDKIAEALAGKVDAPQRVVVEAPAGHDGFRAQPSTSRRQTDS